MSKAILFAGKAEHGKTVSTILMKEKLESLGKKCLIINFADYLKFICKQYYGWNGNKDEQGREILQKIGTNIVRKKCPTFWVDTVINFIKVFSDDYDYFLVGDCRFPDEINCFKYNNIDALSIKVIRLNFKNKLTEKQRKHPSETALDNFKFDYIIESESGLDNLGKEVDKFLIEYNKEK